MTRLETLGGYWDEQYHHLNTVCSVGKKLQTFLS